MARQREIIGGLVSVVLHVGLLAWASGYAPAASEAPAEPEAALVEIELLEITPLTEGPLALRAEAGREGEAAPLTEPSSGEVVQPRREVEPVPADPVPPRRSKTEDPVPTVPAEEAEPADADPTDEDEPDVEAAPAPGSEDGEDGEPMPSPPSGSGKGSAAPRRQGTREGLGPGGVGDGRGLGIYGTPNHAAYGAEIVRLVKAKIDEDPVPGLGSRDSVELVLEVLPNGRLARWGMGKYDYAQVVHSTLGPLRMRAILRRVLRASEAFPPHPSSFPRQRFVVGITVNFRELRG